MQERLLCKGYDVGGMGADAKYGKNTAAAVKRLQEDCGIQIDGIVGINTVIALLDVNINKEETTNKAGNKEDIRKLQNALNANYGEKLEEDGILGSKTKSAVQAHWLSYRQGEEIEEGAYVLWVQERLLCKGYDVGGTGADAKYGKNTAAAVKRLQEDCGIQIDGIVGINTVIALLDVNINKEETTNKAGNKEDIRKLQNALNANYGEKLEEDGILGSKTKSAVQAHWLSYRQGEEIEEGAYVLWVQERLLCKGYDVGGMGADAKYGKNTAAAVKRLQEDCGIQIDGIVGINTVIALLSSCHK